MRVAASKHLVRGGDAQSREGTAAPSYTPDLTLQKKTAKNKSTKNETQLASRGQRLPVSGGIFV